MPRYANRKDDNHADLRAAAKRCGALWYEFGLLDAWLWIPRFGMWTPVEIKRPDKQGHAREFTPEQKRIMDEWAGKGARWLVWRTPRDVIESLGGSY